MKSQLNLNKVFLLLKRDWIKYRTNIFLIFGGSYVLLTLISMFLYMGGDGHFLIHEGHTVFFPMLLIWLGAIMTSLAFRELNSSGEREFYLVLPASHLEKYLSKFIITAFFLPLVILVSYFIFAKIYDNTLVSLIGHAQDLKPFRLMDSGFEGVPSPAFYFLVYISVHSIFFLGAITFRKIQFMKTLFVGFFFMWFIVGISFFLFRMIFPDFFDGWTPIEPNFVPNEYMKDLVENNVERVARFAAFIFFPVVFWITAYFKLTEKEA